MKRTIHLASLTLLCAISAGAQVAPPVPKVTEVVYLLEQGGREGTGAKPEDTITIKGSGLKDTREENPLPTRVLIPVFDASRPSRQRPLEVDPYSVAADRLTVKLPLAALAGGYIVQLGTGDTAIKSGPIPVNVRPDRVRFFEAANFEQAGVVHAGPPYGVAFNPDGTFWYGGDFWGWNQDDYCTYPYRDQFDQGLFLYTPEGKRVQRIDHCASTAVNTGSEHWYSWIQNVQSQGGAPAWTCRYAAEQTVCQGSGSSSKCDNSGGSSGIFTETPTGTTSLGGSTGYYQALTGKGERLFREPVTGNYVLMRKKKDPDTGAVTEERVVVHNDGGLAGGVVRLGRAWMSMYTGAGGHIAFMISRQGVDVYHITFEIIRFKPDGTLKDVVPLGTAWPFNGAFDCAGNLFLTYRWAWGWPSDSYTISLKKLAWIGSAPVEVDHDVLDSLGETNYFYGDARHGYLSGINQQGDLYFYTHVAHREEASGGTYGRCVSYAKEQNSWIRHPSVRGEGCIQSFAELVRFVNPGESIDSPSSANITSEEACGFTSALPPRIPIGNIGSYGIQIKSRDGVLKCTAKLKSIKMTSQLIDGRNSCNRTGVDIVVNNAQGASQTLTLAPLFNGDCLVMPGATRSCGSGCMEIRDFELRGGLEKKANEPTRQSFPLLALHSGSVSVEYEYFWPQEPTWGEPPTDCQKDDRGRSVCRGTQTIAVQRDETSEMGQGNTPGREFDAAIAWWADETGVPGPILKAIGAFATQYSAPRFYQYDPKDDRVTDYLKTDYLMYMLGAGGSESPFYETALLPHYGAPGENECHGNEAVANAELALSRNWPDINYRDRFGEFLQFSTRRTDDPPPPSCQTIQSSDYPRCGLTLGQMIFAATRGVKDCHEIRECCKSDEDCECDNSGPLSLECSAAFQSTSEKVPFCNSATLPLPETSPYEPDRDDSLTYTLLCPPILVDNQGSAKISYDIGCMLGAEGGLGNDLIFHLVNDPAQTTIAARYGPMGMPYYLIAAPNLKARLARGPALNWKPSPTYGYGKRALRTFTQSSKQSADYWDVPGIGAPATYVRRVQGLRGDDSVPKLDLATLLRSLISRNSLVAFRYKPDFVGRVCSGTADTDVDSLMAMAYGLTCEREAPQQPACTPGFCPLPQAQR